MTAVKERLHHIIDEIQEEEATKILEIIENVKADKETINSTSTGNANGTSKVEWDPGVDDEIWKYVC